MPERAWQSGVGGGLRGAQVEAAHLGFSWASQSRQAQEEMQKGAKSGPHCGLM